jgi:hypothetical protein
VAFGDDVDPISSESEPSVPVLVVGSLRALYQS